VQTVSAIYKSEIGPLEVIGQQNGILTITFVEDESKASVKNSASLYFWTEPIFKKRSGGSCKEFPSVRPPHTEMLPAPSAARRHFAPWATPTTKTGFPLLFPVTG